VGGWHRLARLLRTDPVRPHHLVVLVFDDVAVQTYWPGFSKRIVTRVT